MGCLHAPSRGDESGRMNVSVACQLTGAGVFPSLHRHGQAPFPATLVDQGQSGSSVR
jgi:hypothetical protein